MMPYLVLNFCMAMQGILPPHNQVPRHWFLWRPTPVCRRHRPFANWTQARLLCHFL
jgi:hypothetical protein